MRRRLAALAIGAGACALTFTPAAIGTAHPAGAARPLRLTVGTLGSIGSLDPRHGVSDVAKEVWNLQYPTLTTLDPRTLDPAPGLAAAWAPAPGGTGWIYKLRPGLAWSDGRPVTAADVVYSLDHARDERWPYTEVSGGLTFLNGLTAVALDNHSVQVSAPGTDGSLPGLLLHVVPEHVFSRLANLDTAPAELAVSDGTWHVTEHTPDSVELDAARGVAGPAVQQIVLRTYPNAASLFGALAHKRIDAASGFPYADLGRLDALSNVTVDHANDGTQWLLRDRVPDERVRQAISLAIDRTELVVDAVDGVGTPGVVPVLAFGATWSLDASTVQSLTAALDAQPERARALLRVAPPLRHPLLVAIPRAADAQRVGALVRRALAGVGVATTVTSGDEHTPSSTADLVVYRQRFTDNPFRPYSTLDRVTCDGCGRSTQLPSTDFTTLVSIAHARLQAVTEQAKVVGLFEPDTLQAFRSDNVAGWLPDPELRSLAVFAPTVAQYGELRAATPPPGDTASNAAYAAGAAIVLALCGAAYWIAARVRRRYVTQGAP